MELAMREPPFSMVTLRQEPFRFAKCMLAIMVLVLCGQTIMELVGSHQIPARVGTVLLLLFMLVVLPQVFEARRGPSPGFFGSSLNPAVRFAEMFTQSPNENGLFDLAHAGGPVFPAGGALAGDEGHGAASMEPWDETASSGGSVAGAAGAETGATRSGADLPGSACPFFDTGGDARVYRAE
jgi:hypothetical protein